MIGIGLRTLLLADASISTQVGAARIYPVQLPQNPTLPAITLQQISFNRPHSSPQGALSLAGVRMQVDCWATTFTEAQSLADLVRKRIDGYRGTAGDYTVQGIFSITGRDLFDSDPDPKLYRVSFDYEIWYEESID